MNDQQIHRAAGVLIGSAVGDALGAGYEFTHPRPDQPIEMIGGGLGNFAPGEWTDDTSMTVAVAQVSATGADLRTTAALDAVAANFLRWYDSRPKDIGIQTSKVLARRDRSAADMQRTAAALPGRKGGNGSLMRTAAVGIAYPGDEVATAEAALAVSRLTHDDQRAGEACQIWSILINRAVATGVFDTDWDFLGTLGPDAEEFWRPLKVGAETGGPSDFGNNGWVVHALQTAWWAITHADATDARQLQQGLELAVRAGHDTDTTAAIAGALLGARWGASAVPARWRRILHGWPGLRADDLIALAVQTVSGGVDPTQWPAVLDVSYSAWKTGHSAVHPHDDGVLVGGADAMDAGGFDAIVSLCRVGTRDRGVEHVTFWLIDAGPDKNPNLEFVLDDAARTVKALREEGKRVLLHCVEGSSRTPGVAARYSMLLGRDPQEVLAAMSWARPNPELWRAAVASMRETP